MDLGRAIKKCRNLKNMTQTDLAGKAGIAVSYLSRLERNGRDPNIKSVESIANALDIPLSILVILASKSEEIDEFDSNTLDETIDVVSNLILKS